MNITKDTTTAQIAQPVRAARQRLATFVSETMYDAEAIAGQLESLAWAEGEAMARNTYLTILCGGLDLGLGETVATQSAREGVTALLFRHADDTYADRKNDVRRAYADGVRGAVTVLVRGY